MAGAAPEPAQAGVPSSTLELEIDRHFKDGKISVWVDGKLEYAHLLPAEGGKRLLIFHKARGQVSQKLFVSPGKHRVGVRVRSRADRYDQRKEILCTLAAGTRKTLRISFDGPNGALSLGLK